MTSVTEPQQDVEQVAVLPDLPGVIDVEFLHPRKKDSPVIHVQARCDSTQVRSRVSAAFVREFQLVKGELEEDILEMNLSWSIIGDGETFNAIFVVVSDLPELVVFGREECLTILDVIQIVGEEPEGFPGHYTGKSDPQAAAARKKKSDAELLEEERETREELERQLQKEKEQKKKEDKDKDKNKGESKDSNTT